MIKNIEGINTPVSDFEISNSLDQTFSVSGIDVFKSVFPSPLSDQFDSSFDSIFSAVEWIVFIKQNHVSGRNWNFSDPLKFARILWAELSHVPINSDDEIEEDFLQFPSGTDQTFIWSWFENSFDICIGNDLL